MTQAARSPRTVAAAALKESVRVLTKYKNTENPNKRLLHQKLDKALADRQELLTRHNLYEIESAWLADRIDAADDICDEVTVMIEEIDEAAEELQRNKEKALTESKEKVEIQLADLQCASEEKTLGERVQAMKDFVTNPVQKSKDDGIIVRSYLTISSR